MHFTTLRFASAYMGVINSGEPCLSINIIALLALISVASCSVIEVKKASEFKQNWESANKNNAASWWYMGETDSAYYLTEKYPFKRCSYVAPKTLIILQGVQKMEPCKRCKGFNLKYEHVLYAE